MSEYFSPPQAGGLLNAIAVVMGSPAYPTIRGTVRFVQTRGGTVVKADIAGLPHTETGFFAFHLHEGTCARPGGMPTPGEAGAPPDYFPSSGSHFNPGNAPHPRHAGDFPPLLSTNQGTAQSSFLTDRFTVAQAIGHAVIIHLNPDDFHTQPSGNAGQKIACGLVLPERA